MESLFVPSEGSTTPLSVSLHPVVLLSILDQHIRRDIRRELKDPRDQRAKFLDQPPKDRAIGVLLGQTTEGTIEVTNSFGVFHAYRADEVSAMHAAL
jgi:hypothetical protein